MATVKPLLRDSGPEPYWKAAEAIPINRVVRITTESTIALGTTGEIAYPIEEAVAASGESVTLVVQGIGKAVCAEAIEAGERIAPAAEGKIKKWASGQYAIGVAREKGESGQVISFILPAPPKA